jgi:GMP synthase (glutamine-hydrolysing)
MEPKMPNWLVLLQTETEKPANIIKWLSDFNQNYKTIKLWCEKIPEDLEIYNGLIIMGGVMSANDENEHPFLSDEIVLIQKWLKTNKPLLAICLGAQLMASALNKKVYRGEEPEIGWFPIQFNEAGSADLMFQNFSPEAIVFQWHNDTFDLPSSGLLQASSAKYSNQVFRIKENAYALQFHPEMDEDLIRSWVKIHHKKLVQMNPELLQKILTETKGYLNGLEKFGRHLIRTLCNRIE